MHDIDLLKSFSNALAKINIYPDHSNENIEKEKALHLRVEEELVYVKNQNIKLINKIYRLIKCPE